MGPYQARKTGASPLMLKPAIGAEASMPFALLHLWKTPSLRS